MPKVVHFELPFDDAARANQFYAGVFGWESSKFEGGPEEYYLQQTGGDDEPYGIGGALIERAAALNRGGTLVVLGVDDLDAYIGKVTAAGCEIVTPRTPIPGVGYFANFRDTEGNVVGMFQDDNGAT
jgi:predicted enzyme related to lactoylglutathione lyase